MTLLVLEPHLTLNSAPALESLGLVVQPSKGIVDAEGGGVTELKLVDVEGGRRLGDGSDLGEVLGL